MADPAPAPPPLILKAGPPARRVVLPFDAVDAGQFGVGELLDIGEALGTDLQGLAAIMRTPGIHQQRLLVAIAWIMVRRLEPDATFTDAHRWHIEVAEQVPDPKSVADPAAADPGAMPAGLAP